MDTHMMVCCSTLKHGSAADAGQESSSSRQQPHILSREEAASGQYSIFDVVLPLPGTSIIYPDNQAKQVHTHNRFSGCRPIVHACLSQPGSHGKVQVSGSRASWPPKQPQGWCSQCLPWSAI